MNIALCFRQSIRGGTPVECYPRSFMRELERLGHRVTACGEQHEIEFLGELDEKQFDAVIEIENGRNAKGELLFQQTKANWRIPSVVWFIDSHAHGGAHRASASHYNHVFFAPWVTRDLFKGHPSAHWCPNATDLKWFGKENFRNIYPQYDFVFVSTKGGLARAERLVNICKRRGWSFWVNQLSGMGKHKWPYCGQKMKEGAIGYNWGQKCDGPNQRVFETMAVGIPLLNDLTSLDGMNKLFEEGKHFLGYSRDWGNLEEKMEWMVRNISARKAMADAAYELVIEKHTIKNRVLQILEILK